MLRDNARKIRKSGGPGAYVTECVSVSVACSVFIRTALPCSGDYHMDQGGMPLHDSVGINCKKGTTTENQGEGVKHMG